MVGDVNGVGWGKKWRKAGWSGVGWGEVGMGRNELGWGGLRGWLAGWLAGSLAKRQTLNAKR